MKVSVATIADTTFRKWSWWSNWIDVCVLDINCTPFLLQMRISRANRKQFNAIRMTGLFTYRQSTCAAVGDLTQMSDGKEAK